MITVLAGGTGSAKLIRGLSNIYSEKMNVIVNVGDNISIHGLYVCPDLDTILYALSGILDTRRGWGVKNDTFNFIDQCSKFNFENWFKLGDKDLAIHLARTEKLKQGYTLSEITKEFSNHLNISHNIIPASNQNIETMIMTADGEMHLQQFWVKLKAVPQVLSVRYNCPEEPKPAPGVLESIFSAEKIVICPANPVTSIGPIVHIPLIRNALCKVKDRVVAVSPIIGDKPVSGPAEAVLQSIGVDVSPIGVAKLYSDFAAKIIIDRSDEFMKTAIEQFGVKVTSTDILMNNDVSEDHLADFVLNMS
ncbi:MAG TPA: 2-phospho-L-lactate transferase [Nitrososphaerales archaeon]